MFSEHRAPGGIAPASSAFQKPKTGLARKMAIRPGGWPDRIPYCLFAVTLLVLSRRRVTRRVEGRILRLTLTLAVGLLPRC
jgi:hypothetical protein